MKWKWIYSALRDRWQVFDVGTVVLLIGVLVLGVFHRRLELSRNLAFSVLVLLITFTILPWTIFGSAFADMRIMPYILALALLAIRFRGRTDVRLGQALATIALLVFAVRLAATSVSLAMASNDQEAKLGALDRVPEGARLVSLVGIDCGRRWVLPRDTHLPAMAIVRRHAFSNDQWAIEGANLLSVRYRQAGHFLSDPSQIVRPEDCARGNVLPVDAALAAIPRDAFDYLWVIDLPPHDPRLLGGMTPIWRGPGSLLYAVDKPGGQAQP